MSVWGSGDAEYFRAAIFRGSYTFRMARIETFSRRSQCQSTGRFSFSFFPPLSFFISRQFYLWSMAMAYLDFFLFLNHLFFSKALWWGTNDARIDEDRQEFQCAVSCMWMDQWNQSGLSVQCPLSLVQSNHVWHCGLFLQQGRNQGW